MSWLRQGQIQNAQFIEAVRLPAVQLPQFNGDPISYWPFIRSFERSVASSLVDDGAKLIRLVNYCCGSERKIVEGCMIMHRQSAMWEHSSWWRKDSGTNLLSSRLGFKKLQLNRWLRTMTFVIISIKGIYNDSTVSHVDLSAAAAGRRCDMLQGNTAVYECMPWNQQPHDTAQDHRTTSLFHLPRRYDRSRSLRVKS